MAARNALIAILAALWFQRETGMGQYIDVSIMESVASQPPFQIARYSFSGGIETRGPRYQQPLNGKYLQCKDGGWIVMSGAAGFFESFADLLGLPELLDPKFADSHQRTLHTQELDDLVTPKVKELDRRELFHTGEKERLAFGMVQTPDEVLNCSQLKARDFFQEIEHPKAGRLRYPGGCAMMSETPGRLRTPAPLLGCHNREIYCGQLGYTKEDLLKLREQGVI